MRPQARFVSMFAGVVLSTATMTQAIAADSVSPAITAAVADAGRPDADKQRDADRRPAEVITLAGIKVGDRVADFMPGGGYFTRIFSKIVGRRGKVYAVIPAESVKSNAKAADGMNALAADPNYSNTMVVITPVNKLEVPEPLDVFWTSLNYHDLHNKSFGPADMKAFNEAVFRALRPGGIYMIIDHVAEPGHGAKDTEAMHRIDRATVTTEVTAAGFQVLGESDLLKHEGDDHKGKVFDSNVRGKTDQFVMRFRKP